MDDKNFDKMIKSRLRQLDKSYPDALVDQQEIWAQIQHRKSKKEWFYFDWKIGVAASLLIISFCTWVIIQSDTVKNTTLNESNISLFETEFEPISLEEKEAMEYIKQWCISNIISCRNEDFLSLRNELKESKIQLELIKQELVKYGDDPAFVKAQSRVERHRSNVIKQIIQTL